MGILDVLRPKRFMSLRLFEVASAAVARVHIIGGVEFEDGAARLAGDYRDAYCPEEAAALPTDLALAAKGMLGAAKSVLTQAEREPTPHLQADLLRHFQWYASNHQRDGSPTPKRLLNGTAFDQADFTPDRAMVATTDFIVYGTNLLCGLAPAAPPD